MMRTVFDFIFRKVHSMSLFFLEFVNGLWFFPSERYKIRYNKPLTPLSLSLSLMAINNIIKLRIFHGTCTMYICVLGLFSLNITNKHSYFSYSNYLLLLWCSRHSSELRTLCSFLQTVLSARPFNHHYYYWQRRNILFEN